MSTTFELGINIKDNVDICYRKSGETGAEYEWLNPIAHLLPYNTPVRPIDNTAQGIRTIGDIVRAMQGLKSRYIIQFEDGTLLATHDLEEPWVASKLEEYKHSIIYEDDEEWDKWRQMWTIDINKQGTLEAFMEADDIEDRAVDRMLDMRRCK